jgi:DNA-binding transcriptional ArsR family regulator
MNDAFALLADPGRRQILDLLRGGERSVGELCEVMPISQPGVSKHLRLMREAGLVSVRADAQRRFYRLEAGPLQALDRWLQPYRQFWSERLDALEHHLDQEC